MLSSRLYNAMNHKYNVLQKIITQVKKVTLAPKDSKTPFSFHVKLSSELHCHTQKTSPTLTRPSPCLPCLV